MARIVDMHKKWLKEPKYKKAYEALEEEFALVSAVIDVRNRVSLTQKELARKMGNHAARGGAARKWTHAPFHADPATPSQSHSAAIANSFERWSVADERSR